MQDPLQPALAGQLIDEAYALSLDELCSVCQVEREQILALVEEGVLHVGRAQTTEWRFAGSDLQRALSAVRLQRDLQVNPAGAALALQLLEQIQELRSRLLRG